MADDVTLNSGSGGDTIAADDIAGVKFQRVKLVLGANNTNDGDVASGNPIPVTGTITAVTAISNALPAGTNNIGDVDVLSLVPGTGATNLGKAIDTATGGTDTGVLVLATRDDALSALTPVEGDNIQLRVTSTGALWVQAVEGDAQKVLGTDTYTEATSEGIVIAAVRRDADTPLANTTNEFSPLITDANGYLKVEVFDGGGSHTVDNAGTFAVQVDGSALTALQVIDNPVIVDDAAFTAATTSVMMSGFIADETPTADSADSGDGIAVRATLDRKLIVTPEPHTNGGLSIFRSIDLDETEEEVKATAGQVYACWVTNTATATRFVKFYNATAANVTVGTTTPVITIGIPGNSSDDIAGHFTAGGFGIVFDTAITVAATTAVADADTGAPGANEVIVNIFYK
jgi:hypothetical protein